MTDHLGRSNFAATIARRNQVRFFAVDLLHLNGGDLRGVPLVKRKESLKRILPSRSPHVLYVDYTRSSGGSYAASAASLTLKGSWPSGPIVPMRTMSGCRTGSRSRIRLTAKRKDGRIYLGERGNLHLCPARHICP